MSANTTIEPAEMNRMLSAMQAQIATLQKEVAKLPGLQEDVAKIPGLTTELAKVQEESANLKTERANEQAQIARMQEESANLKTELANEQAQIARLQEESANLKAKVSPLERTVQTLVMDRGLSVSIQTLLFAVREQPLESDENSSGSRRFSKHISNPTFNNALTEVFNLKDLQQKMDKLKSSIRNTKVHPNTVDELREQAAFVKENFALQPDGVESTENVLLKSNIIEILDQIDSLATIVSSFGSPIKSKRKGASSESPKPAKHCR